MNLIEYDGWTPSQGPTSYEVKESDVYASQETTEDGHDYIERTRLSVHEIPITYTNLIGEELEILMEKLEMAAIPVKYFYGKEIEGTFRASKEKTIKLKYQDGNASFWNVSFTIKEI